MEGVNLEEKCLLLKSADKEEEEKTGGAKEEKTGGAKEEKGGKEEKEDLKAKDGLNSTAVKLVGQVQK